MSASQKLINKAKKLKDKVRKNHTDFSDEVLSASPAAYDLTLDIQRKFDRNFGKNVVAQEPKLVNQHIAVSIERVDFDSPNGDYGLELTMPSKAITSSGIKSGDEVAILEGVLDGRTLDVIEVLDSTHLRLDDVSMFSLTENNVKVKFILS